MATKIPSMKIQYKDCTGSGPFRTAIINLNAVVALNFDEGPASPPRSIITTGSVNYHWVKEEDFDSLAKYFYDDKSN